jgi:CRISPR-associated endonuclease Csn1
MQKKILGLDLGSNSIGWALMGGSDKNVNEIIDLGSRIFNKAVEEKVPTPKNVKRRDARLGRRVLQRRAARKQRMINYLISLDLLPQELTDNFGKEGLLNNLGNPYKLRVKALDKKLDPYEFGRIILHFASRRGFLSSKKQLAGDLIDDPDTQEYLSTLDNKTSKDEEGQFKADIQQVYQAIKNGNHRTLGEYLFSLKNGEVKRNRNHDGGHLRTDRKMYQDELALIWQNQQQYFSHLPDDFMQKDKGILQIIFYQRPLKLKKDRVGKCSLEVKNNRVNTARLEVQRFRYLQDVNNLKYFEREIDDWVSLDDDKREKLINYFENNPKITTTKLKELLGLDRSHKLNLESKNLKGNITACEIRSVIGEIWDNYPQEKQQQLFEDLFTIKQKSALKARLITHWDFDKQTAVKLCLIEFEPSHSNHSLKAIKKLLPFLEQGLIYSDARVKAGYGFESEESETLDKLPQPIETSNPIVNKGMHELRRLVNAVIKKYGKPDIIRIEMARDLEMNTKRYKENEFRQKKNQKANEKATEAFLQETGKKYANRDDKIRYRLWKDQDECCAYSGETIALTQVFSSVCEVDHILPFKKSLDDSYMNKVLCFAKENQNKKDKTPIDAFSGDENKWNQITHAIGKWKYLDSKIKRFYTKEGELQKRDFISNQLNDTRYISRLSLEYLKQLGCDVSTTKGQVVAKIRHQWGFNDLIGETDKKERTDHRHHAIDAVVIASTSRGMYQKAQSQIKHNGKLIIDRPYEKIRYELDERLKHIIISHDRKYKLSGALHEETGAGYIAKHGGLVYRKTLGQDFTIKNAMSIVDEQVKGNVLEHIENYENPKIAFNEDNLSKLKLGKNPIKRVRVLQSKTTEKKLAQTKFGVKDKSGKVFKYMSYGNTHHAEIIQNTKTGKIKGEFVTMMEAHKRAKGIGAPKQNIIKTDFGDEWEFLMALHINDMVSVKNEAGERVFYRVQMIDIQNNKFALRLNTASTLSNKDESLIIGINKVNFDKYDIKLHKINVIGNITSD